MCVYEWKEGMCVCVSGVNNELMEVNATPSARV